MNRVSWSVEGIDPSVRERAEAAAKRAGMSLAEWINSQLGDSAPQPHHREPPAASNPLIDTGASEVAEIHHRLDSIARQIEQISRPPTRGEPVARQLNDAISRLDARLARITEPKAAAPQPAPQPEPIPQTPTERVERAAAQVYHTSPPLDPNALDLAIAEIAARQSELDAPVNRMPPRQAPPIAPAMSPAGPDFSSLEQQLRRITSQIDALQRPDQIEKSITAFRAELAEIRHTITEAMPRKAIEQLESEIKSLARRLDDTRAVGTDAGTIAGIERALAEIHAALRSLTPAEQLAGFDEAIRNLGGKIDMIVRNSDDPGTMQQLENAIGALRGIVSNVASNEALEQLSANVHTLADKVDQLSRADSNSDSFAALENRITALTAALESRERPAAGGSTEHLEGALRALSERLDHLPIGNDSPSAFAHLEQRVSYLLERMEQAASQRGGGNLERVEEGLQDILRMLERQQESFSQIANRGNAAPAFDSGMVETIKREISDIRFSQSETDRHTQDSLEAVHNTLGHVVDRLAMIETDLRSARTAPQPAPVMASPPREPERPLPAAAPRVDLPPRPELPNPAAATFAAAPREFAPNRPEPAPGPAAAPRSISDILDPSPVRVTAPEPQIVPERQAPTTLPPDHPLEPGTRPPGRIASPSERIAASENALSEFAGAAKAEPVSSSSFIAAARRAAQAAASATAQPADKSKAKPDGSAGKPGTTLGSKIRSLLVGASVVVIVLGSFKIAMNLLDGDHPVPAASLQESASPDSAAVEEEDEAPPAAAPAAPAPAMPSMTSPTPINRQSLFGPQTPAATAQPAPAASAQPAPPAADITGSIPAPAPMVAPGPVATISIPAGETLPDAIGGPALRKAALKGDAAAAYEVGTRFAEGKGMPVNAEQAAKWYARAAQAGIVPAMFRMGTLNEKGLGVTKDLDVARRYYVKAADRGNAKAMHNLAVLEADGGGRGANYKSAAEWFRKAAERGVPDSQFNLGILYARGIGVEQNLAESYKWFSLAAAQGDADAGKKRDDVAKRLDPQSLSAAKLAVQTFMVEPQPDDAVKVAAPAGGWDAQPAAAAKSAAPGKRAAR